MVPSGKGNTLGVTDMAAQETCQEWLEEHGRCDLEAGHYPKMPHLLVTCDRGICWKVTWPFDDQDPDVKRYMAEADAYEAEDNRQMAASRSHGA